MAETACLMRPFSYASGTLNEVKEGNPIQALRDSISFGRFVSESLAWEKWSSFSHNRYVEEAEKYSQPGSVAQKKAFFEAHYKRIAAKKAEALLEQANAAAAASRVPEPEYEDGVDNISTHNWQTTKVESQVAVDEEQEVKAITSKLGNLDNNSKVTEFEISGKTQTQKPLLKKKSISEQDVSAMSKKKPALSSSRLSVYSRASKLPSSPTKPIITSLLRNENNVTPINRKPATDSSDKNRLTPKSIPESINFTPAREPKKSTSLAIRKIESSSKPSKDCLTPLRTPTTASVNTATKHASVTPRSENRRARTPLHSLASGSKTIGPKWRFLSVGCSESPNADKSQSPILSAPFSLRTEERAARRKKLEENFNAKEAQKVQLQTKLKEKAESELKKLRQSLCFKARPLPEFYKDRETPKNQTKKIPLPQPQSPKLRRNPSPSGGTSSLPPRRPSIKKSSSKHVLETNSQSPIHIRTSLAEMLTHENTSPNIQLL